MNQLKKMNWTITYREGQPELVEPSTPFNPQDGDWITYVNPDGTTLSMIWNSSWDSLPYSTSKGTFRFDIIDFSKTEQ